MGISCRNPASPSLGFFRGLVRSEDVPPGWWGIWDSQRATESLLGRSYVGLLGVVTKMLRSTFIILLANLWGWGKISRDSIINQPTSVN